MSTKDENTIFNFDYRKRYFFDENQRKIENKMDVNKSKPDTFSRKSLTIEERLIIGIRNELLSYKKMLEVEKQKNISLYNQLCRISNENIMFKNKLNNIKKQLES